MKQREVYAPDWIDVNTQLTAIGDDFGQLCRFTISVERDRVTVVAKCYAIGGTTEPAVTVQALASRPIKSRPDVAVMCFGVAQDCWRQLDSGNLGGAGADVSYGWGGRPNITRR